MSEKGLRTAARYLGVKGKPDEEMIELVRVAWEEMLRVAMPRHQIRRAGVGMADGRFALDALAPLPSRDLCRLFAGASEGLALIATLGASLDGHIRRLMLTNPALGAAVGACGGAYIDEYIDTLVAQEAKTLAQEGLVLSPRFSPGYGDVPLSYQAPLLNWLEAWRVGVTLTDGLLMQPEKSVSALIALRRMDA